MQSAGTIFTPKTIYRQDGKLERDMACINLKSTVFCIHEKHWHLMSKGQKGLFVQEPH